MINENSINTVIKIIISDDNYSTSTSGTNFKFTPDFASIELIAWNIVVAFGVNVVSSYFYENYKPKVLKNQSIEVKRLQNEIELLKKEQSATKEKIAAIENYSKIKENYAKTLEDINKYILLLNIKIDNLPMISNNYELVVKSLKEFGWSSPEAQKISKRIVERLADDNFIINKQ